MVNLVERLLAVRPLDGWEIMAGSSRNLAVEVKDGKVETFRCAAPVGVSVRVLCGGGMGFSFSTSLAEADLLRMIDNASVSAATQSPDEHHEFPEPQPWPETPGMWDEGLAAVGEGKKIALALELERRTLSIDQRLRQVRKATYNDGSYYVHLRNSRGVDGGYRGTSVSCAVTVIAEEGGDSQMGWDFHFSPSFAALDPLAVASGAAERALGLLGARKVPSMRCPAVIDRHVAADLLQVLAPSFLADSVRKGKSLLADKVGTVVCSPLLRIRDDGTLSGGMATTPCDGEGAPHRNTVLVADGVLQGYLFDTLYARKMGAIPTGNAVRSGVKGLPHIGCTNLFIENGISSVPQLLAGIDRGVLITDVIGMHTANPISGDFSVGASGFMVEQGKVTVPARGMAIAGNVLELFRNVELVGDDLRFFGALGAPSLRIASLDVSGE